MDSLTGEWIAFAAIAIPANMLWCVAMVRRAKASGLVQARKVGGLHFVRVGRFGASFWKSKAQ